MGKFPDLARRSVRLVNEMRLAGTMTIRKERRSGLFDRWRSENRRLSIECTFAGRPKGLAKDTPERQRVAAIDAAIAAHKAKREG